MAIEEIAIQTMASLGAFVGGGAAIALFIQFITNLSRNMAHTGTNVSEEISRVSRQP